MILPVNEQYRIKGDQHSWAIERVRKRKKNGKVVHEWQSFQWYTSFEQAVNGLGELMVRTSDAETLADALREVEKVYTTLSQALTPKFRVIRAVDRDSAA